MRLQKVVLHKDKIYYETFNRISDGGDEVSGVNAKEAPLPAFYEAWEAVRSVVQHYMEKELNVLEGGLAGFANKLVLDSIDINYSDKSTRKVFIDWHMPSEMLLNGFEPKKHWIRIDQPSEGEEGMSRPPMDDVKNGIIQALIDECEKYVKGERQQLRLPLEKDDEATEPEKGDQMDWVDEEKERELPFNDRVNRCNKKEEFFKLIDETLKEDWSGADMPLADLKTKAINAYKELCAEANK